MREVNVYLPIIPTSTRDIGRVTRASEEYYNAMTDAYGLDPNRDLKVTIEYEKESK